MIFRNPQLLALLLLIPAFLMVWIWRRKRVAFLPLLVRLATVATLVLALADPVFGYETTTRGPALILVDQSDSLTPAGQTTLRNEAERLAAALGERATVLWFAANVVVAPAQTIDEEELTQAGIAETAELDRSASDLAAGLRAARQLLAPTGGQIILLSDGLPTTGAALAEAERAAAAGLQVDTWHTAPLQTAEISVASLTAPQRLRVGEEFPIQIVVEQRPDQATGLGSARATLRLWEGEQLLAEEEVQLIPGSNDFTFRHQVAAAGIVRLRATISGGPDTFERNNLAGTTAMALPPPLVLLVEGTPGSARDLSAGLRRAGVENQIVAAAAMPARLSDLTRYDGMVLVDVPARLLSLDQMAGVREFVRSEGRGLVVTGGRNSYGLGGYKDTPLEEVLPVLMEPPPRPERADIALLLIIDRSASMTAALGISKFDMAKEAAILSVESLQPEDRIGILGFDTGQLWTVPFQQIGTALSLQQINETIARLPSGGGTDIYAALDVGLSDLAQQPSSVRHAVLLTDGRSFTNDRRAYEDLVDAARAENISLSTIAIGVDADLELLEQLAEWGGGRYYFAAVPEDIPRLTLLESEIARVDPTVEDTFQAGLRAVHPIMRDFAPIELPALDGYVAVTAKDNAEVVLQSPGDDPILTSWQYGLGRAVAWTSSVDIPWTSNWLSWNSYDRFWAQMVRYTLPEPDGGPIQARLEAQPDGARLIVDAVQAGGQPLDLATVNARVTLPDGAQREFAVRQVAPGRYAQDLLLANDGPYALSVLVSRDGERHEVDVGYVQAPPDEYASLDPATVAQGAELLAQVAAVTDGRVLNEFDANTNAERDLGAVVAPPIRTIELWPWLLGSALLLLLLELMLRRGTFGRE